ncbi:MAG TPA: hypothetical protein VLM89_16215, partial [Phycisphaerae bacterium]|nr:hypothetical protein [Phycisphaerae bacterium]
MLLTSWIMPAGSSDACERGPVEIIEHLRACRPIICSSRPNIRVDADGKTLIAAKAGKVHLTQTLITVFLVTSVVYPGVKVIFGDRMAVFRKERRGPVKIERRLVDRVEEICVID